MWKNIGKNASYKIPEAKMSSSDSLFYTAISPNIFDLLSYSDKENIWEAKSNIVFF